MRRRECSALPLATLRLHVNLCRRTVGKVDAVLILAGGIDDDGKVHSTVRCPAARSAATTASQCTHDAYARPRASNRAALGTRSGVRLLSRTHRPGRLRGGLASPLRLLPSGRPPHRGRRGAVRAREGTPYHERRRDSPQAQVVRENLLPGGRRHNFHPTPSFTPCQKGTRPGARAVRTSHFPGVVRAPRHDAAGFPVPEAMIMGQHAVGLGVAREDIYPEARSRTQKPPSRLPGVRSPASEVPGVIVSAALWPRTRKCQCTRQRRRAMQRDVLLSGRCLLPLRASPTTRSATPSSPARCTRSGGRRGGGCCW